MLKQLTQLLVDFAYPKKCFNCQSLVLDENKLCAECWQQIDFVDEPFCNICGIQILVDEITDNLVCGKCYLHKPLYKQARSLFVYNKLGRNLIKKFKYYDHTYLAKIFAKMSIEKYKKFIQQHDFIIHVPMLKQKRLIRQYDHAYLLAKELSKISNIKLLYDVIVKEKYTTPQMQLDKKQRLKNLQNSFKLNNYYKQLLKSKKILLVDDVTTTGATADSIVNILNKNNIEDVNLLTIAKTYLDK